MISHFRGTRILKPRGLPDCLLFNEYPLLESLPEMWPFIFDPRLLHLRVLLGGLGDPRQLEGIPAQGTVLGKEAGLACWKRGRRLPRAPSRRASQQLQPRPRSRPRPRVFLAPLQGWAEARACLLRTYGRGGAGLLLFLSIGSGSASRPRPRARPCLRTKSGLADGLRLTASGSAAQPRPHAGARFRTRSARAGRRRRRGPAWVCDAPPVAPPLPAASADPSGCADGRRLRVLSRPGPVVLGRLPAPAAAELPPSPLLGPPGTAASAPCHPVRLYRLPPGEGSGRPGRCSRRRPSAALFFLGDHVKGSYREARGQTPGFLFPTGSGLGGRAVPPAGSL